ncbi:hypothetical protein RFI_21904 [Reticulomyxa filosa]|uniref:Sphingomyelin synthase-like domain-containing protein n=1 Tax=Reticulomyxa filosa TaxID=46433 RepID=X6MQV2_RETFI|nr:hypothetical protein RFI_21904 [Reticulomyxa filosa]|eukprot:ETO15460.1 hypothetical protein RFI_21904 [Reticulomyxa filosa]
MYKRIRICCEQYFFEKKVKSKDIEIVDENVMIQIRIASLCGEAAVFIRRLIMAIIFFLASTYLMCIANVLTEKRSTEKKFPMIALPDFVFDFAEKVSLLRNVTALIVIIFLKKTKKIPTKKESEYKSSPDVGQYIIVRISIVWLITCCKQLFIVLSRFLIIHSFLFLYRASCLLGTQLSNPYQGYPVHQWSDNILYEALLVNLRYKITRTDVFYSGHTMSMTCLALMIGYYHDNTLFQRFLKKKQKYMLFYQKNSGISIK